MDKMKVAVLFGGMSTEHEVSCVSVCSVIKNFDKEKFDLLPIGLAKNGDWLPYSGPIENIRDGSWESIAREQIHTAPEGCDMAPGLEAMRKCQVVFPILHGLNCEDGTVQGLLELLKLPYVGCNVLAAAVGMDKAYTKIVADSIGVPQCKHIVVHRDVLLENHEAYTEEIASKLGFPCFVKPSNSGSSVGVFKVKSKEELVPVLLEAQKFDRKTIVEEYINGREIECAVLGNRKPCAATPGEIKPSKEFYDYEDKYKSGTSETVIPAELPQETLGKIKEYALAIFKGLDCSGLSRVDFFYEDATGRILFNEINTLPGFTEISMYSKLWAAEGMDFTSLLTKLVELAFERQQENYRAMI